MSLSCSMTERRRFSVHRLNLGCGKDILDNYINGDLFDRHAQILFDARKLPFKDDSVGEVLASHLIEHFDFREAFVALEEWKRVLKPGGRLIVETPDFLSSCQAFITADEQERVRLYGHFFAMPWIEGQTHKFLYTETQLGWTLRQFGFQDVHRIEAASAYTTYPKDLYLRMEGTKC